MTIFIDRISDLPRDIKQNILVRLPVKDAVRTCCLSRNWRFSWSSIPELVFDEHSISYTNRKNLDKNTAKMTQFVDMFLSLHDGSIRKFVLSDVKPCCDALNRWMGVLLRKGIEEIKITSVNGQRWMVPSAFWNLRGLREVALGRCIIELPQAVNGFKLLKSLEFEWLTISEGDLTNLISSCPVLENLSIMGMMHEMNLRIDAPMLKQMKLICWGKRVCLRAPSLVKAHFCLNTKSLHHCERNLIDLLGFLPNLETLRLSGRVMKYLTFGYDLGLSVRLYHLKSLYIQMNFACQKEAAIARQLFHHAPNLQELTVEESYKAYAIETEEWVQHTVFENLKFVEICSYENYRALFNFVKFLLASAPVLEKMYFKHDVEAVFLEKLVQLKGVSKEAKIFIAGSILP